MKSDNSMVKIGGAHMWHGCLMLLWVVGLNVVSVISVSAQLQHMRDLLMSYKTLFDETNPVWVEGSQTLFFAVHGHPSNVGVRNLPDIWVCSLQGSLRSQPVPLSFPVNTELAEYPVGYRLAGRELYFMVSDKERHRRLLRSKQTENGFTVPEIVHLSGITDTDSITYMRLFDDVLTAVVWRAQQSWVVIWRLDAQGLAGDGHWVDVRPSPSAGLVCATFDRQARTLYYTATGTDKREQGAYTVQSKSTDWKHWSEPQPIFWLPDSLAATAQLTISEDRKKLLLSIGYAQNDLFFMPLDSFYTIGGDGKPDGHVTTGLNPQAVFQCCVHHKQAAVSPATFVLYDVEKSPRQVVQLQSADGCTELPLAGRHLLVWATVPGYFVPAQPVNKQAFDRVRPDATQGIAFTGTGYVHRQLQETDSLLYELDKQRKAFKLLPLPALPQVEQLPRGKELEALRQAFIQYKQSYQSAPADVSVPVAMPDTSETARLARLFSEYAGQTVTPGTRHQKAANYYAQDLAGLRAQFSAYHGLVNNAPPAQQVDSRPPLELTQSWLEGEVQRIWQQQLKQEIWSRIAPSVAGGIEQSLTAEQRLNLPQAIAEISVRMAEDLIPAPPQSEKLDRALLDLMRQAASDYLRTALEERARQELEVELRYHALRVTRAHLLQSQVIGESHHPVPPADSAAMHKPQPVALQAHRIRAGVSFVLPALLFAPDSDRLLPESYIELDRLAHLLLDEPNVIIEIAAHTHSGVAKERALYLTAARSRKIEQRLVAAGIASNRISAVGLGNTRLLDHDHTFRDMFDNERIEIRVVRTK